MAINRVDFGGNTLIDLTGDTLESAEQLLKGIIAHAKDGSVITGQMEAGGGGTPCLVYTFTPANDILDGSYEIGDAPLSELDYYLIQTISSRTPSGRGYLCIGTSGKVTNTKDGYTSWYRYTSSAYGTTFFEKKFVTSAKYSDRTGVYIENGKLYLLTYYYNLPAGSTTTIICGCI